MQFEKFFKSKISILFIYPFFLGCISVFSFQPFNYTFINFLIIPMLFLIVCYVAKTSKSIYRKKPYLLNLFLIGYFFGVGFFLSGTHWISYSLTFDDSFKYLIPFSVILIPAFLGIFFGFAILISGPFLQKNFISVIFFCSSISFLDFLRSKILSGFPWNLWSYSWSWFPEIFQILNPIGLFAFNLLTIIFFCSPVLFLFNNKKKNILIFMSILVLFFVNYIFGSYKINERNTTNNSTTNSKKEYIDVKVVSANFDLEYNLSSKDIELLISNLIKYSDPDKDKKTLFVWPEGVFTGYNYEQIIKFKSLFKNNFSENHLILFGINTIDKIDYKTFNSLLVVNNKLDKIYQYKKKKLVPFGEFLPFEKMFNNFGLKKITQGYGSFSKGDKQKNFLFNGFNILPLICYEIIFPELIQENKKNNLIVNISEDAWFGGSIGPQQHFAKAIFRAVENNTYLVRSANQGISAFINNKGQIIKRLEPREKGNIELRIPLVVNNDNKNKNDLIFFILLFTYTLIFFTLRKK